MSDNVETMAYVKESARDVPWHGLGNPIAKGATVDEMKIAAGLNWGVGRAPVEFTVDGQVHSTKDFVIYRDSDLRVFDTVGPTYTPFQNDEVLEFFREYVEVGDMYIDTAGALENGRTVWAQASMQRQFTLPGGDTVQARVLLMNPHQYGKGGKVKLCTERVVCRNTLNMALGQDGGTVCLPHNKEFNEAARQDAKKRLGIAREKFEAFEADASKLATITMNDEDVEEVMALVFPKQEKVQEAITCLYLGAGMGSELESANGTAWGVLNAVTEYYDWWSGRDVNTRIRGAWDGNGASKKRQALAALLGRAPQDAELVGA